MTVLYTIMADRSSACQLLLRFTLYRLDVFILNISFQGQHKKVIVVLIGQMILTYVISETGY